MTYIRHMSWPRTLTSTITGATVIGIMAVYGGIHPPEVLGDALPNSPTNPATAARWVNPDVRTEENHPEFRLEVVGLQSHIAVGETLPITIRVINDSPEPLHGFSIVAQHANIPESLSAARNILAQDSSAFPYFAEPINKSDTIAPGQSREISISMATNATTPGGLAIATPGTYPISLGLRSAASQELLSTQRFLIHVGRDTPPEPTDPTSNGATSTPLGDTSSAQQPTRMSVVFPLTAQVDIVGGEMGEAPKQAPLILHSEQLAQQLTEGGRLDELLDDYADETTASPGLSNAICLALDPQLVDTVARMADGYMVSHQRPSSVSQNRRLRDSWNFQAEEPRGTVGYGAEAAREWLDRLAQLAQQASCTVALPWANTDINAVAATGNQWTMREAIQQGTATIARVLNITPLSNVVIPGSGYITEQTAPQLRWADTASFTTTNDDGEISYPDIAADWSKRASGTAPSEPAISEPVSVLVADNTVWNTPQSGRFAYLAPGVRAVSYPGSLAATLAEATPNPITVGYGSYSSRYDSRIDALAARRATGDAAIRMTVGEYNFAATDKPLLVQMPPTLSDATQWLSTIGQLLDSAAASPMTLSEYVTPSGVETTELDRLTAERLASGEALEFGAPYDDPTVISDTEVLQAQRQLQSVDNLTQLMMTDPAIALTPYGFTAPLRHDVLRAFTHNDRAAIATYDAHVADAKSLLNNNYQVLTELRTSVTLLPPGNVYTRISDSSPLLIVAQNGLPLPVDARIRYNGPRGAHINVPENLFIPAKGSITVHMTADLPTNSADHRTDLSLWLAANDDSQFSEPVTIGVQTRSGIIGASGLVVVALIGLVTALFGRIAYRRIRHQRPEEH
ncbi:hypothetical protein CMUST_15380 [Corynebacterium mustelae]|uniref:Secreted protein n=1 Tax=Corynebacterium mustelae TaxID=571915 RepID=A0A0G3H3N3_9CORY|nr:hypothetical protein [Corynebacterium mustelae]AKK07365.1 hypothetical protein CMUST_15380 [Corynebacterium mustelae]